MKKSSVIATGFCALILILTIITMETRLREMEGRLKDTEERMEQSERALKIMEPVQRIFSGYKPDSAPPEKPYQAIQTISDPDAGVTGKDSPRAWCPAEENSGEQWLMLDYGEVHRASGIQIHAAWNGGSAVRVLAIADDDHERVLWSGMPPGKDGDPIQKIDWGEPQDARRIKIIFDTAAVPGWNEIDAVALHITDERMLWAVDASGSSHWEQENTKKDQ